MREGDDNWQRLGDVVERVVSRARNKGGSRQGEEREETCRLPTRPGGGGNPARSETELCSCRGRHHSASRANSPRRRTDAAAYAFAAASTVSKVPSHLVEP